MDAQTPLAMAGKQLADIQIKRLVKLEPGAKAGEVDAVHQMRVATRRLRSLLAALEAVYPKRNCKAQLRGLRRLARSLAETRNLDVIAALVKTAAPSAKGAERLAQALMERKVEAIESVRARLKEQTHQDLLESLETLFETRAASPSPRIAEALPALIWERYGALRAYEPNLERLEVEELHELRIEGKRLRYVLEFFETPLGNEPTRALIAKVVAVQDAIGELHDADLAMEEAVRHGETKALGKSLRKYADQHQEAALVFAKELFTVEFRQGLAARCAEL